MKGEIFVRIVISILAILFGLLHVIAARTQLKSADSAAKGAAIAMLCGGVCTAAMAVAHLAGGSTAWMDAPFVAVGCLLICTAACANGKRSGNFHLSHHIIRGGIAALLVAGFLLW